MNDFDKYFADKLNEETRFPRVGKNWNALTGRLDAYAAGVSTGAAASSALLWKLAACGLLALSGYLAWDNHNIRLENQELQEKLELEVAMDTSLSPEATVASTEQPATTFSDAPGADDNTSGQTGHVGLSPALWRQNGRTASDQVRPAFAIPEQIKSSSDTVLAVVSDIDAMPMPGSAPTDTTQHHFSAVNPLPVLLNTLMATTDTLPLATIPTAATTLIQPHHEQLRRFRVGVQVIAGFEQPPAVALSDYHGVGLNAAYSPLKNFWLTASADWMSYQVQSKAYLPRRFYHGEQPKKTGPDHELWQIDGQTKQQQYSLGLRYVVPLRFALRPAVRIAHSWVRENPGIFSFAFEDKLHGGGPGGPNHGGPGPKEYVVEMPEPIWKTNNWRMGASLEYNLPRWTISLGADYISSGKVYFNAVQTYAGLQYKF
ncbi:MAG: hypothetical protein ACOYNO_11345 [Saprospiraceae bacterium]